MQAEFNVVLAQHRQGWNRSFIFVAATFAIIIFAGTTLIYSTPNVWVRAFPA